MTMAPEKKQPSGPRILIYTGDGKGKTSAALGTALRAAGHSMTVFILQFVKNDSSTGEIRAMAGVENVEIEQGGLGFVPEREHPEWERHRRAARQALERAGEVINGSGFDMVVLDEVCGAVHAGLLEEADLLKLVTGAPADKIIVLTGRGATDALIEAADTVSEVRNIKHGLETGLDAQRGVEL
jgi:cob(I)alamin adenosyltransferase